MKRSGPGLIVPCGAIRAALTALILALALAGAGARADEGGVPFWFSGQYASFGASPASPGLDVILLPYMWAGTASKSKEFPRAGYVTLGLESQIAMAIAQVGWTPDAQVLGGRLRLALGALVGTATTKADLAAPAAPTPVGGTFADGVTGAGDLYPAVSLGWNAGVHSWMTYATGGVPVGAYDADRLAMLGIGHAALDLGGGYTFHDAGTGLEATGVTGLTFNFENPHTQYTNGINWHLDWAASKSLSEAFHAGVVGYLYAQLTPDSYPTEGADGQVRKELLGDFRSGIAAVGGEVGVNLAVGGHPGYLNVRGYWEFWSQNRLRGYAIFATIAVPVLQ